VLVRLVRRIRRSIPHAVWVGLGVVLLALTTVGVVNGSTGVFNAIIGYFLALSLILQDAETPGPDD
jgi:hypothetical protein